MKVHLRGRPRPGVMTQITCRDSIMGKMLECVPDMTTVMTEELLLKLRKSGQQLPIAHRFLHGAYLHVGPAKDEYFISINRIDGSDGMAAIEELKMFDALRKARAHFIEMKIVCYDERLADFSLRVTQLPNYSGI